MFGISFSIRWLNFFLATCARGQFFRGFSFCLLSSSKFSPFPIRFYAICSNAWSKPVGIDDIVFHTHPKKLFSEFPDVIFFPKYLLLWHFSKNNSSFLLKGIWQLWICIEKTPDTENGGRSWKDFHIRVFQFTFSSLPVELGKELFPCPNVISQLFSAFVQSTKSQNRFFLWQI